MLSALPNLLDKYKTAWETHDLELLDAIFTQDVHYQEKPDVIFNGILELKTYWEENKRKQQNVQFVINRFIQADRDWVVDWEARFQHKLKNKIIRIYGIMWLTLKEDKIDNFKEFFTVINEI
jgi:hypothetical protein